MTNPVIEALAALEHEQWAHWTRYMFENMTPENVAHWHWQVETPYAELTETEKDSDRVWARKFLQALKDNVNDWEIIRPVHENMVSNGYDISPAAVTKAVKSVIAHILRDTAMKEETDG